MKKVTLFALSALAFSVAASAQVKLDATAAQLVSLAAGDAQAARSSDVRALTPTYGANDQVAVIVTVTDGNVLTAIENLGGEIADVRGDMAIVRLTPVQMQDVAELSGVLGISLGYENRTHLLNARAESRVDQVQAGLDLPQAYDGTGVICGLMDTGIDPNHVNFLKEDGTPRIEKMWVITGSNGAVRTLTGADKIASYSTDLSSSTHGTHTLGIMAGSYKGNADLVATISDRTDGLYNRRNAPVKYYGVATGADIAPCAGTLDGNNVLIAAGNILDYAKEQGKPAVMNLSLGHNFGPHDGTTAACKYLAEVGKEMLITVSAGNEGGTPLYIHKDFKGGDNVVKTTLSKTNDVVGAVDIWGSDETPFDVTFVAVNKKTGDVVYSYKVPDFAENDTTMSMSIQLTGTYYNMPQYIRETAIDSLFSSRSAVIFNKTLDPSNNRFNVYITTSLGTGSVADIVPGLIVEGKEGAAVDMYCNGYTYFYSNGIAGYTDGDDSGSINDLACGDNILAVGAYTNVSRWPSLSGIWSYEGAVKGSIADFSSYGKSFDGRQLPHIAAPGHAVVASYNYYYQSSGSNPYGEKLLTARVAHGDRESYWEEASGTSMSAPLVGGILALWLQADPTLTMDDVMEILEETAITDSYTEASPERFGYGKIDAYGGICKILGVSAVNDVKVDNEILVNETSAGTFGIYAPGASNIDAALYSMSGVLANTVKANGEEATISAENLTAGVYLLNVTANGKTVTRKVVVR